MLIERQEKMKKIIIIGALLLVGNMGFSDEIPKLPKLTTSFGELVDLSKEKNFKLKIIEMSELEPKNR